MRKGFAAKRVAATAMAHAGRAADDTDGHALEVRDSLCCIAPVFNAFSEPFSLAVFNHQAARNTHTKDRIPVILCAMNTLVDCQFVFTEVWSSEAWRR